jgi:hypothetical protein
MTVTAARTALLIAAGGWALACSEGSGAAGASSDAGASGDAAAADPQAALGGFMIDLVAALGSAPAYTAVLGKVYGGAYPSAVQWTVAEEAGGCRLLTPRVPFCDPGCGGTAVCVEDGRCQPFPTAQNLGRVSVSGVGAAAFEMEPIAGNYQPGVGVSLPYPPFSEGAAVQMQTSGGGLPTFSLASVGIAPLEVQGTFALADGQPLPVRWTPPGQGGGSRIEIKLDISHHGGTRGKIECDVADTGALDIPAAQISRLLALGVAGFPTIVVTRAATGTTALAQGKVTLRVIASVEQAVEIPGLRSCTEDRDCPAGQTCQSNLACK